MRSTKSYNLKIVNPTLAKEWHPTNNNSLTPSRVTPNSGRKVWWKCSKGHEWLANIYHRNKGSGCPYCSGRLASDGTCLQVLNPALAKQWHFTKNGKLTPKDVKPGTHKKAWWICRKGHEWQARIYSRHKGRNCPYCANQLVNKDNCLEAVNPSLAKEWHPSKNEKLTPSDVLAGSRKRVWWRCKRGHEWITSLNNRNSGVGCPFCHSQTSLLELRIYAELKRLFSNVVHRYKCYDIECDVYIPHLKFAIEIDGTHWHKDKYVTDTYKNKILKDNGIFLLRLREYGLNKISKDDIIFFKKDTSFELIKKVLDVVIKKSKTISSKIKTYLKNKKLANESEFIKLLDMLPSPLPGHSLADKNKPLSKEWHPAKNGSLTPKDVTPDSGKKAWWICKKGHEWYAVIWPRNKGVGCPYCSNRSVNKDNCLQVINPVLAKEWHPTKNGKLTPRDVTPGANKKAWWKCKEGHEWLANINNRNNGNGCPYCTNRLVCTDNNLEITNPELIKEWHPTKNGKLTPKDVTFGSHKKVWWLCKKGHEWKAVINKRSIGRGCHYCTNQLASKENCLQTINPTLSKEWHPTKNQFLTPKDVTSGTNRKVWWICTKGHEWQASVSHRNNGRGCPYCSGRKKAG